MSRQLRVLFIEDSEDDAFIAAQELARSGFDPSYERVETLPALEAALDRQVWDVILSDHSMPCFNSLQALDIVKRRQCDIPFIIVSGVIGEETAVKAMKAGASDYVMKNALSRLAPSVERELTEASNRRILRQAEKALRRSQYDLNDFFENAPLALHWAAPDGVILRINAAELKLLGYGQHQCLGHCMAEFFTDKDACVELLRRLRNGETVDNYQTQLRCRDGSSKDVQICANGLWDDGKLARSRWFISDITERKIHEQTSGFLASIVASSADAIIGTDLKGNIVSWNAGATQVYGYTEKEALGRSIRMLAAPNRPEESPDPLQQVLEGKHVERYETFQRRNDEEIIPTAVTLSLIRDRQGKTLGVSIIATDITQRKLEEQEKLYLIQELSHALGNMKALRGQLPICMCCKKIRDEQGAWTEIESFIADHSNAEFAQEICPDCEAQLKSRDEVKLAP